MIEKIGLNSLSSQHKRQRLGVKGDEMILRTEIIVFISAVRGFG
jgi:hypothetical protein